MDHNFLLFNLPCCVACGKDITDKEGRCCEDCSNGGEKTMTDDSEPYICEVCGAIVDSKENDVCDDCVDDCDPQKKCGNCGETMGIDAEQCPNCKKHMADQHYSWLTNTADTDLIEDLEALVGEFDRHDYLTSVDCASRLRMVMDRHRSGGND